MVATGSCGLRCNSGVSDRLKNWMVTLASMLSRSSLSRMIVSRAVRGGRFHNSYSESWRSCELSVLIAGRISRASLRA